LTAPGATPGGGQEGLVNDLAFEIRERILAGEYPIGSRLRQEQLAERFGVSRMPVREALRILQASGAVVLVPNRGAVVRGPTPREIREAYAVRAELEGFGAGLAAELIDDAQLERLREAERLFRESVAKYVSTVSAADGRDRGWTEANDLFHEAILTAAGNQRLHLAIRELHRSFPRNLTWSALSEEPTLIEDNVNQHGRILAAIDHRDPGAARRWMTDHVRRAGELVASWYGRQGVALDRQATGGP
jgi:DNA-binding GntR family transcriptional regulator